MYWDTLTALAVYLSLQVALGILYLILWGQPWSHKSWCGLRAQRCGSTERPCPGWNRHDRGQRQQARRREL